MFAFGIERFSSIVYSASRQLSETELQVKHLQQALDQSRSVAKRLSGDRDVLREEVQDLRETVQRLKAERLEDKLNLKVSLFAIICAAPLHLVGTLLRVLNRCRCCCCCCCHVGVVAGTRPRIPNDNFTHPNIPQGGAQRTGARVSSQIFTQTRRSTRRKARGTCP